MATKKLMHKNRIDNVPNTIIGHLWLSTTRQIIRAGNNKPVVSVP